MKFEQIEYVITLLGLFLGIILPIWYFFVAPRNHFYDFNDAKKVMEQKVVHDHRLTIYCQAAYDAEKIIYPNYGFTVNGREPGQLYMDWEHAVPVAEFGRNFREWTEGDPSCVRKGRHFKGRRCATQANEKFRRMEGDMYNLFPAINAVNQARGNKPFARLRNTPSAFGSCEARFSRNRFEPPDSAKGPLARAALYMANTYETYTPNPSQLNLFEAWNSDFPVEDWECKRAKRIEKLQGNENAFVKKPCIKAGLW